MIFEYVVVGQDGKEQQGKIEAASEGEARKKLNEMGLSILSVTDVSNQAISSQKTLLKKFIFSGKDSENQEVEGEIEAKDEVFAYKRLVEEFHLNLLWLIDAQLPKAVQEAKKGRSIEAVETLLLERGMEVKKQVIKSSPQDEVESDVLTDENFKLRQQKIIEKLNALFLLTDPFEKIIQAKSPALGLELEKKLNALAKIKMSNNLLYIEESSDEIINDILQFFDRFPQERIQYKKELLDLEAMLSHATKAKTEKFLNDIAQLFSRFSSIFFRSVSLQKKTGESDENQRILRQLILDRREVIRLLFYHLWGILTKVGELRRKHKEAFFKLLRKYKTLSESIRQVKLLLKRVKEFHMRDMSLLIEEIEYFCSWLFGLYLLFFVIAEISLLKSKLLPASFIWSVMKSGLIMSISFGLFLLLWITPLIRKYFSKNIVKMLMAYLCILGISVLFYFNY